MAIILQLDEFFMKNDMYIFQDVNFFFDLMYRKDKYLVKNRGKHLFKSFKRYVCIKLYLNLEKIPALVTSLLLILLFYC